MPKYTGTVKINDIEHAYEVFVEHERNLLKSIGEYLGVASGGFTIASVWHHWHDKDGNEMKTKKQ